MHAPLDTPRTGVDSRTVDDSDQQSIWATGSASRGMSAMDVSDWRSHLYEHHAPGFPR